MLPPKPKSFLSKLFVVLCVTFPFLCGCNNGSTAAVAPSEVVEVAVTSPNLGDVSVIDTYPGRVVPFEIAEIRPQVGGIVRARLFREGSDIAKGQPLFESDSAPFIADSEAAAAAVVRAQATLERARIQADRLKPLADIDAISRQSYDDARTAQAQAAADVAQLAATQRRRQLDKDYATVRSPIAGRIEQALLTEGALVSAADTKPLAVVQRIDQVFVDLRQPITHLEELRRLAGGSSNRSGIAVSLLMPDGTPYVESGRLVFSGITVDPSTNEVIARVVIPNRTRSLLPGMFVRANIARPKVSKTITVPEQAIQHDYTGNAQVLLVDGAGVVRSRRVTVGDVVDNRYVVLHGLSPSDHVIVEGLDRVAENSKVKTTTWAATK